MTGDIGRVLAEEAEAAEEHRDDDMPMVRSERPPKEPAQVYSLRIPVDKLERLRRLAAERHMTPSALMRSWVLACLEEASGPSLVDVVRMAVRAELVHLHAGAPPAGDLVSAAHHRPTPASVAREHRAEERRGGRSRVRRPRSSGDGPSARG